MQGSHRHRVVVICALAFVPFCFADVRLPAILGDNMVLQQETDAPFWGWADPGEAVTIKSDWDTEAKATADDKGRWKTTLKTIKAGGPHTLTIAGKNTITLKNVLLGEVWLCSGQSNMEWSVGPAVGPGIKNHVEEVKNANFPNIRLFTVKKNAAQQPQTDCEGRWQPCAPEAVSPFSATAYFFGRKLHQELNVPIGLIHSSWGGTEVELWMSEPAMRQISDFSTAIDGKQAAVEKYQKEYEVWRKETEAADPGANQWQEPALDDKDWTALPAPTTFEKMDLAQFDGVVWFRAAFDAPAAWANQSATLELGPIDDEDITWINGKQVGATQNWQAPRRYEIPAGLIKAGKNSLVVRVYDRAGLGGFAAPPEQIGPRRGDERVALANWKYKVAVDKKNLKPEPPPVARNNSLLYNGMIAPLLPYAIRGAVWYQGEANVGRAFQYRTAFPAMIRNWRADWGRGDFPFYFVQIAPFAYKNDRSQELREAQALALATPNTGMVVTTDITDNVNDIHPINKQDVGGRLALWALAKTYGKSGLVYSGPLYKSMRVEGDKIRLQFEHVDGGLMAKDGVLTHFTIAGEDHKFVPAKAEIDGETVVVSSPDVKKPAAVRFGWSDTPTPNLFNKAGLPASPFRTDDWPGLTDGVKW